MRWIWIDRFVEFDSGKRAKAIKNVTLAEDHLHDHFPGYPIFPNSLITEGLAQTGGLLVGEKIRFQQMVVLAKVSKALFHGPALPGDQLLYTTDIESLSADGARIVGKSHIGERLQAEVEIQFHFLGDVKAVSMELDPKNFMAMMKLLGVLNFPAKDAAGGEAEGITNLRAIGGEGSVGSGLL